MVSESWIFQAIQSGKTYDALSSRIKATVSLSEWKAKWAALLTIMPSQVCFRVKQYCIQHGYSWAESVANTSSGEQEYYEELLEYYRKNERLFPYHLDHYICRILRVTSFRYYSEILFNSLKEEKAYDKIPNFTAADILRHTGIGRNEYISILDACRAKKFIWRMNRNIAKERLPNEPVSMVMGPWWKIGVVNLTENEFRALTNEELEFLRTASNSGNTLKLADVNYEMLRTLYRRGLVYTRIPIRDDDKFTIPPLEGFISNRNVSSNAAGVDPMETLLYAVFIANSENMPLSSLAGVLTVDIGELRAAMAVAVRLGFATRIDRESDDASGTSFDMLNIREEIEDDIDPDRSTGKALFSSDASSGENQAIAVLVDAEITSFLMMGLLSPGPITHHTNPITSSLLGIKRHAVTLFEGGRITGDEVISHLISELRSSADAEGVDGEIRKIIQTASSLAELLESVKEASGDRSVELLRKQSCPWQEYSLAWMSRESLEGLSSEAVTRVLAHGYRSIVPIAPLSGDPLSLDVTESPLFFGPTGEVASLWFQLTCYEAFGQGPISYIFTHGERVRRLPEALRDQKCALLSPFPFYKVQHLVHRPFLLHALNELCRHGPVMLQPLFFEAEDDNEVERMDDLEFVDVPLPLIADNQEDTPIAQGFVKGSGEKIDIQLASSLINGFAFMGLDDVIGFIRFSKHGSASLDYVPFHLYLGVPLEPLELCNAVCALARERKLIDPMKIDEIVTGQQKQAEAVRSVIERCTRSGPSLAPLYPMMFDGHQLSIEANAETIF